MVHMNAYYIYGSDSQDDQSIHSIGSLFIIGSDMSAIDPHEYDDLDTLSQMDNSDLQPVGHGHHVSTPVRSVFTCNVHQHSCMYIQHILCRSKTQLCNDDKVDHSKSVVIDLE